MKSPSIIWKGRTASKAFPIITLTASLAFCLCATALAKKGGGGKPGNEEPPEPEPAPINYAITWLTDATNDSRLWDVDANGVAVGQIRPGGDAEEKYGIISFPGRPVTDVEALVRDGTHDGDQLPADFELTAVFSISDGLLVGGDLVAADGTWHAFAAQLIDDGVNTTVDWFRIFPGPAGADRMFLTDASENGEHFVLDVRSLGAAGELVNEAYHWSPLEISQDPEFISQPVSLLELQVNNAGQICWSDSDADTYLYEPLTGVQVMENESRTYTRGKDIADDGTVVGGLRTSRKGSYSPARWTAASGWERLSSVPSHGVITSINNAGQMIGKSFDDSRLFFYSDADGYHELDDLIVSGGAADDVDRWLSSSSYLSLSGPPISGIKSDPESLPEYFGYISGAVQIDGLYQAFILTPVPVTP